MTAKVLFEAWGCWEDASGEREMAPGLEYSRKALQICPRIFARQVSDHFLRNDSLQNLTQFRNPIRLGDDIGDPIFLKIRHNRVI